MGDAKDEVRESQSLLDRINEAIASLNEHIRLLQMETANEGPSRYDHSE